MEHLPNLELIRDIEGLTNKTEGKILHQNFCNLKLLRIVFDKGFEQRDEIKLLFKDTFGNKITSLNVGDHFKIGQNEIHKQIQFDDVSFIFNSSVIYVEVDSRFPFKFILHYKFYN